MAYLKVLKKIQKVKKPKLLRQIKGRIMFLSKCTVCGGKKPRFVKSKKQPNY